jgi:hypothetical protein
MLPNIETPVAILGVIAVAFLVGFGLAIGWWLWGKICAALGI